MGNTPDDASPHIPSLSRLQLSAGPQGSPQIQQSVVSDANRKRRPPQEAVSLTAQKDVPGIRQPPSLKHGRADDSGLEDDDSEEKKRPVSVSKGVDGMDSDDKTSEEEPASRGSGESKMTHRSTAEDWFKDFNTDVEQNNAYFAYDDDPPYYLPNQSIRRRHHLNPRHQRPVKLSRLASVGPSAHRSRRIGATSVGKQGQSDSGEHDQQGRMLESTSESNSDSYRSVIDDLTIKNQKLKRRLRRLEELQAEHLQTDKLFELRIHGLSLAKRQELEGLLQRFTASLHSPSGSSGGPAIQDSTPQNNEPLNSAAPGQNTDSAYASNSGSGGSSIAPPSSVHPSVSSGKAGNGNGNGHEGGNGGNGNRGRNGTGGEISPSIVVPEKVKMKLVVRRLEQLFTGRTSSFSRARHPQAETGITEEGHGSINAGIPGVHETAEGAREASLMSPSGSDTPLIEHDVNAKSMVIDDFGVGVDQRPTRPIDLDPRRPQIPEENLEYLHNLTSSSAKENANIDGKWDGWVYLNLIINLAQLHTINVTLPFVKKAITTMSSKLELSPDGKMVRWKGGNQGSNLSSESGSRSGRDSQSDGSPDQGVLDSARGRQRIEGGNGVEGETNQADKVSLPESNQAQISQSLESSTRMSSNSRSGSGTGRASGSGSTRSAESFHYKPLFAQSRSFNEDSSDMDTSSLSSSELKSGSSYDRMQSGDSGDRGRRVKKANVGPIIYYENGNFCTDLSAQDVGTREASTTPDYPYERMTNQIVGLVYDHSPGSHSPRTQSRPLLEGNCLDSVAGNVIQDSGEESSDSLEESEDELAFSPKLDSNLNDHPALPMELEASGIGGVQPEDNFAINVQVKHYLLPNGNIQTLNARRLKSRLRGLLNPIPQSSIEIFRRDENSPISVSTTPSPPSAPLRPSLRARHKVVDERVIRLPPSTLPPAGYMFFSPSSDDSSRDSDSPLGKCGSRSYYSAEMDTSMRDESGDDKYGEGEFSCTHSSLLGPRSHVEEMDYTPVYKGGAVGSVGSGKVVIGRVKSRLEENMADSSAATAGSVYGSTMSSDDQNSGSNESLPLILVDSDQSMEDDDGAANQGGKSSDGSMEGDEDENDSEEQPNRPGLKQSRSSKTSLLAIRKI